MKFINLVAAITCFFAASVSRNYDFFVLGIINLAFFVINVYNENQET